MKRILFFGIVLLQVLFLALISFQYSLIDQFGKEIRLETVRSYSDFGWIDHKGNLHPSLAIESIKKDQWSVDPKNIDYNEKVYILLEENKEGFHEVKEASTKKLKAVGNEVLLAGKFNYENNGAYEVDLQLNNIRKEVHESINPRNPFIVTIKKAPWGQRKITKVEKD